VKLDRNGDLDTNWGTDGIVTGPGFNYPGGVAEGSNDSIYVADVFNHRIVKLNRNGGLDTGWGDSGMVTGPGFNEPYGVAVGSNDSIYVADTANNRIVKFTATAPVSAAGNASDGDCSDQVAFMAMIKKKGIDFGNLIDCGALDKKSMIEAGQLKSVKIEPQGRAGSSENVKIKFTPTNPVLEGGEVVVTFPEGFKATEGKTLGKISEGSEEQVLIDDDGQTVTVELASGAGAGEEVVLTLSEINHSAVSGAPTEGGSVETQTSTGVAIDSCLDGPDCTIEYTDVEPGILTGLGFRLKWEQGLPREDGLPEVREVVAGDGRTLELLPTAAGSTGVVLLSFTTANPVPAGGTVEVTFPKGFDAADVSGRIEGEFWPSQAADEGTPTFDEDSKVEFRANVTYRPEGSSVIIEPTSLVDEDFTFPSGAKVHLWLTNIKNPAVTGVPEGGAIVTKNRAGVVIDRACGDVSDEQSEIVCERDLPVSAEGGGIDLDCGDDSGEQSEIVSEIVCVEVDLITPGKLDVSENGIRLDNKKAGGTGNVTVTFTLDNPLPFNGAIAVTLPKGFRLNSGENITKANFINPAEGEVEVEFYVVDEETTVVFFRKGSGVELKEGETVELKLTNIRNPQVSGPTHNFEIRTSVGK
jgi:hypothetical protein